MNVQRIFEALGNDQQNSALGIICSELEQQGYSVVMNGHPVESGELFGDERSGLDKEMSVNISLLKDGAIVQEFSITFEDFHEIAIRLKRDD